MRTTTVEPEARDKRLARRVTVGTILVLLLVAAVGVEAWPLTAFRLFSAVRTDTTTSVQLVVVSPDGSRTPLRLPSNQVLGITAHQFVDLAEESPAEQRRKVRAWLGVSGIDPEGVASVELVRTTRSADAAGTPYVTDQVVVVTVAP